MQIPYLTVFLATALLALAPFQAGASDRQSSPPNVVVSIKPLHSLVASVMKDIGEPALLLKGNVSPHTAALKPSQAKAIQDADLVFWIGDTLETFLAKSLESGPDPKKSFEAITVPQLGLLPFRDIAGEGEIDHDDDEGDHDHSGHDHLDEAHSDEAHSSVAHSGHNHTGLDPHIWLDPARAKILTLAIAEKLAETDEANAARYRHNAVQTARTLDELQKEISERLAPVAQNRFLVFHDGYQYFERAFNLKQEGAVHINPEQAASAARIRKLQARLERDNVRCLFSEPQFNASILKTIGEKTSARIVTLDPLGQAISAGPDLYVQLLRNMASSFEECLAD